MSRKRRSSIRWVFLFPVAGAAAGSLPAYLVDTHRGQRSAPSGEMAAVTEPLAAETHQTGLARWMVVLMRGLT